MVEVGQRGRANLTVSEWKEKWSGSAVTVVGLGVSNLPLIDFLLTEVGLRRVDAYHDPRNPHSGAVMKNCGMQYEATLRASDRNNQGICDACWYAILKETD